MRSIIDFGLARRRLRRTQSSRLTSEIEATLCPGMSLPEPLRFLFGWIEANELYVDTPTGRIGYLFSEKEMKENWTDRGRPGGTDIEFAAEGNVNLKYWFGSESSEITSRLCVFAKTGGDGSMGAFWLADDGSQKIVHLGSGSGSTTVCILADDPVDFLRLLAIGYDEICWGQEFAEPPSANTEFVVEPNQAFVEWVSNTFAVTIPDRATEIVKYPVSMDAKSSPDSFWQWVRQQNAALS